MTDSPVIVATFNNGATRTKHTSYRLGYVPAFDGLRGIAVLAVMSFHAGAHTIVGGHLGVDMFFVLSGFLITNLLVQESQSMGTISFKLFYIRRALRLLPALLLVIVVCGLYGVAFATSEEQTMIGRGTIYTLLYSSNWYQAFNGMGTLGILSHTWSLSIEEQFYILWPPLLAILLWLRLRRSYILVAVTVVLVLVALHRAFLWHGDNSFARVYAGLDTRADSILIGCLVGLLAAWRLLPTLKRKLAAGLTLLVGLFITAMLLFSSHHAAYMYRGGLTCFAAAVGILLCLLLTAAPPFVLRFFEFRPLAWIGTLSYGLYLWHIPLYSFVYDPNRPLLLRLSLAFGVTFAVATVSYYLVEQPCLRLKKRFHNRCQAVPQVLQAESPRLA